MKKLLLFIFLLFTIKVSLAQINLATGGGGSITGVGQSYNENRGAEVVVLSAANITIQSITLGGFFCGNNGGTDSAYLGARIYNSTTAALLASANDSVYNIYNTNVTIPISYTLVSGNTYRIAVYAWGPHPPTGNSGLMYHPATLPYIEPSGMLQINHGYESLNDVMPVNNNIYIPLLTLNVVPAAIPQMNEKDAGFTIYPNPAHNTLNVDCRMKNAELQMLDVTGRVVYSTTLNTKLQTLNLNLSEGIYFVKVSDGEKVYTQKIVVE